VRISPLLIAAIIVFDQVTKRLVMHIYGGVWTLVPEFLAIRVVFNRGLVLGLGDGPGGLSSMVVIGVTMVLLAVLIGLHGRTPPQSTRRRLGFACMIGGASGNLIDRLIHGHVIDFIHVWGLPVFNVADLALVAGTALVIRELLRADPQD